MVPCHGAWFIKHFRCQHHVPVCYGWWTKCSTSWDKLQEQWVQNRDMDRYGSQNKTILLGHHLQNLHLQRFAWCGVPIKNHPFDTSDASVPMPATKKLMWSIDQRRNVGDHTCEVRLDIYGWLVSFEDTYYIYIYIQRYIKTYEVNLLLLSSWHSKISATHTIYIYIQTFKSKNLFIYP